MRDSILERRRIERWLVPRLSSRRSRWVLALVIGLGSALVSLGACAIVYALTGVDPSEPLDVAVAYGLPFLVPLIVSPIVTVQILRLAGLLLARGTRLEEEVARRRRAEARLALLATVDDLTQVVNRRAFFAQAAEIATRIRSETTVALLDLDRFKMLNDTHGHQAGDDALRRCGAVLRDLIDAGGVAGRLGGDEFGVVLHGGDHAAAVRTLDAVRQAIADGEGGLTASIGASRWLQGERIDVALGRADHALYRAKQRGRNRVEVTDVDDPSGGFPTELGRIARR